MKYLSILIFIIFSNSASSQDTIDEIMPHFFTEEYNSENTGMNLQQYVSNKIIYPIAAKKNCNQGVVYVGFTIDTFGNAVDIKSIYENNALLMEEAKRVVLSTSGHWIQVL